MKCNDCIASALLDDAWVCSHDKQPINIDDPECDCEFFESIQTDRRVRESEGL